MTRWDPFSRMDNHQNDKAHKTKMKRCPNNVISSYYHTCVEFVDESLFLKKRFHICFSEIPNLHWGFQNKFS